MAMFLAQIMHESGGLVYKIESICGSGCFKCPGQYVTQDDYPVKRYCGRGYIQLVIWWVLLSKMSLKIYFFIS